jgi:hypothetical protein
MWTLRNVAKRDYMDRLVRSESDVSIVEEKGEFFVEHVEVYGQDRSVTFYIEEDGIVGQRCSNLYLWEGRGFPSYELAKEFAIRFFGIKKAKGAGQHLHKRPVYEACGLMTGGGKR